MIVANLRRTLDRDDAQLALRLVARGSDSELDALERKGVVGPYEGSKSRAVVASAMDLESIFGDDEGRADLPEGW